MVTVYDVPADELIEHVAKKLKKAKVKPPEWVNWVTTGVHKEKAPENPDWWYVRMASVMRKIYVKGPIGISRLAAEYGGPKDKGSKPSKAAKGSRSVIRKALQQLEEMGYVKKDKSGRVITPQGRSFMDNTAHEAMKKLVKDNKELKKYMS